MLPREKRYSVYPAVVPTDKKVEMTIVPNERLYLLTEGEEYKLTIIDVNGDEPYYYEPLSHRHLAVIAKGGVISFNYVFSGEQEHVIVLSHEDNKLEEFHVFSLHDDLYLLRPMKGDLHSHSHRSDGRHDPAALAGHYREQGYDFFALTDHNRFYPGEEIDEAYADVKIGLTRIRGEEVHVPGSVVHIVHIGGKTSVADKYVHDRETFEKEIKEYEANVPRNIPEQYRERYARAMWATDKIHEADGLAIFPHPFWIPGKSRMYNVHDGLAKLFLTSGLFDAYELLGGMKQINNNRSVAFWNELRVESGLNLPVVGSSDVHKVENSSAFPHLYTICFAKDSSHDAVIEAVRTGNTVAVEEIGTEYERQFRCYGSLRLVTYAQFLLQYFFLDMQRLCQGEGVAMRCYAMGTAGKEIVEMQAALTESYRKQYFGNELPIVPGDEMLEFEEKWRANHLKGPVTKGAIVYSEVVTRQI